MNGMVLKQEIENKTDSNMQWQTNMWTEKQRLKSIKNEQNRDILCKVKEEIEARNLN